MRGVILTEHAKSIIWRIMRENNMDLEPQNKPKVLTALKNNQNPGRKNTAHVSPTSLAEQARSLFVAMLSS